MSGACPHDHGAAAPAGSSRIHALDARAKIVALLGTVIVSASASPAAWPAWVAATAVLVATATAARVGPLAIWRRVRHVLLPVVAVGVTLPVLREGAAVWTLGPATVTDAGLVAFGALAVKALIGTSATALLAATTPWPEVLRGLERLRVPALLVEVAALMHRYAHVLGDEARRMRQARDARGYRGRSLRDAPVVGRVVGTLLVRSVARGERVHAAMLARGYAGALPAVATSRLGRADALFVALAAVAVLPLRVAVGA